MKKAILVLAYGTPSSMDDMAAYLLDVREGRVPSPELVADMQHRYTLIGHSPLNELTQAQARAVEDELRRRGHDTRVYVGMRHWKPWIKDTVAAMKADGVESATAIVMAPHFSSLSIGKYRKRVEQAQQELGSAIRVQFVESWWQQPKFLEALENKVRAALAQFPAGARVKVIFTAHSLPERIMKMGDPYDSQVKANAAALAKRLGLSDWMFAYQSAGASPEPWLGPAIEDVIPDLARQGFKHVLVAPIGFVCDHMEILYDLDIEARKVAEEHGVHFERTQMMNTTPEFIAAIVDALEGP
ncbi:MAG: ferrochelatase [bacterium]